MEKRLNMPILEINKAMNFRRWLLGICFWGGALGGAVEGIGEGRKGVGQLSDVDYRDVTPISQSVEGNMLHLEGQDHLLGSGTYEEL